MLLHVLCVEKNKKGKLYLSGEFEHLFDEVMNELFKCMIECYIACIVSNNFLFLDSDKLVPLEFMCLNYRYIANKLCVILYSRKVFFYCVE